MERDSNPRPKACAAILWKSSQAASKEVDPSMENEEALGTDGMDGFLSNLANAIPGIDEAMSFAEMLNLTSLLNWFWFCCGPVLWACLAQLMLVLCRATVMNFGVFVLISESNISYVCYCCDGIWCGLGLLSSVGLLSQQQNCPGL
ncbi:hypothetical protein LOK49_LG13G01817 [Camellia lanceoleosa]|uniref:Uncharacterized protein n=1 Tax=Camellia lanceoleosa TaxID=1840588 RepID=A0ACC0FGM2_9ERIC|nr:hypothetical protein LOK49_LG13G01817 [Camellia lanceoleosa]